MSLLRPILPGSTLLQDADDDLYYEMSWNDFLADGVQIASSVWTTDDPILVAHGEGLSVDNRKAVVFLKAPTGTVGQRYKATNQIVTDETPPQTAEASFYIRLQDL